MIKLIISDFRDTLIDREDSISTDTIINIDNYRRGGGLFSICSDLGINDVLYYDKSFHFIDYIIGFSGSIIYDVNKEKIIYNKHILISKVKKIIKNIDNITLYGIDSIIDDLGDNKVYRIDIPYNKKNLEFIKSLEVNYYENDKLITITGSNIFECINKLIGRKISYKEVLCIPHDNKFLCCTDLIYCIGLSNCKIRVKKIKLDNNENGIIEILNINKKWCG